MSAGYLPDGSGPRYFGVYPAIVTDVVDKDNLGRIEVEFPWLGADGDVRAWATLLTPYADDDQGFEFIPAKDSQVVVAFEAGHLRRPYVVGACWNGKEKLPETPAAPNDKRLIRTRAGSLLEFDDTAGAAKVTISTQSGHQVVLDDGAT
ncbi:MAG TPA: phage baseplate assembly protein V, partial [Thermoanaerobaculia bacterium]|nr:phage baseplate assembly protein V [Thermoanaerobaculia bacterium]